MHTEEYAFILRINLKPLKKKQNENTENTTGFSNSKFAIVRAISIILNLGDDINGIFSYKSDSLEKKLLF
jgi:hypothetical protein